MTEQEAIDKGYKEGPKSFEHLYAQINKHFRFDRVYTAMKALDWGWAVKTSKPNMHNDVLYIPNVNALRQEVYRLCKEVYDQGKGQISTGGFTVSYFDDVLSVSFTIEEWAAEE
jgi:hypothetical protein